MLNDSKLKSIVSSQAHFGQLSSYLHEKNDIALHMVLCSSIRFLLGGVCRRITMLHSLSHRAISHYENNPHGNGSAYGSPLHLAYQKVYKHTSEALVNPEAFQALLASLNREIREVYVRSFNKIAEQPKQQGGAAANQQNRSQADEAAARGRQHCELQMLLGQAPPSTFQPLIHKFLTQDLVAFRDAPNNGGSPLPSAPPPGNAAGGSGSNNTNSNTNAAGGGGAGGGGNAIDPARLFFANYDLLELDDGPPALERRRARGMRVDMFKRVEISRSGAPSTTAASASASSSPTAGRSGSGAAPVPAPVPWRRCVRCAAVMEDLPAGSRPPLNFVLSQQRNCCCGGRLALVE